VLTADPVNHQFSAGSYFVREKYHFLTLARTRNTKGEADSTIINQIRKKNHSYFPFNAIKQDN